MVVSGRHETITLYRVILLCGCLTITALAQQKTTVFEELPALVLSNDKVELTVITEGGAMGQIVLAADKEKINPIWNPYWIARQAGLQRPAGFFRGHFACLDGFGPVSNEERDAGMPFHGEAPTLPWQLRTYQRQAATQSAEFFVTLPLAQETLTRTYRVVDGENIVWVDSSLTSLLAFDRPAFWGEHATIAAPFLEPGKVAVDMSISRSRTKAVAADAKPAATTALIRGFHLADGADGRRPAIRHAHGAVESRVRPNTRHH